MPGWVCILLLPLFPARIAAQEPDYEKDVVPILARHCHECHSPEKHKGDLNLARLATDAEAREAVGTWGHVIERVKNREMPPGDRPKLGDEEAGILTAWIGTVKLAPSPDCDQLPTDETQNWYKGYAMARRLTRFEYENTIRDLFGGLRLDLASMFPADGSGGEGFDNQGDTLFTSPILIERALEAADLILEAALPEPALDQPMRPEGSNPVQRRRERAFLFHPGDDAMTPDRAAGESLARMARRAYRRPPEPDEILPLMALYRAAAGRGAGFESAVRQGMRAMLVSPNFLFLAERMPEEPGVHALTDHALAARLSYFLWASMPDDRLMELADAGRLRGDDTLRAEVRRMLTDPKVRGFAESFSLQWLGLRALGGAVRPDAAAFPEYDDELESAMREEAVLMFEEVARGDRSLLTLLDSGSTFLNERLARHYGIAGVSGPEMREVRLADAGRGGVLGLGAVLTATSHPLRTSPVLRGKWVMEQLLGERIPPPPPNVAQLPEDGRGTAGLTLRRQMEAHRADAECASCHAKMDPIGFGLENFDPIGRWRASDHGNPIDTAGVLPSGEAFDSPASLKAALLANKSKFRQTFTRKMLGYGLGRAISEFDKCVIDDACRALEDGGDRFSILIERIVLSYPFRHRYHRG